MRQHSGIHVQALVELLGHVRGQDATVDGRPVDDPAAAARDPQVLDVLARDGWPIALPELSPARQLAEVGQVLQRLPFYLRAERRDRGSFLRAVYRRYRGADLAALERFVDTTMDALRLIEVSIRRGVPPLPVMLTRRSVRAESHAGHRRPCRQHAGD